MLNQAAHEFKPSNPSASIPKSIKAYGLIKKLKQEPIVVTKKDEVAEVIRYCGGLWLEAIADDAFRGSRTKCSSNCKRTEPFFLSVHSSEY